jgi:hypothetical protein
VTLESGSDLRETGKQDPIFLHDDSSEDGSKVLRKRSLGADHTSGKDRVTYNCRFPPVSALRKGKSDPELELWLERELCSLAVLSHPRWHLGGWAVVSVCGLELCESCWRSCWSLSAHVFVQSAAL